MAQGVSREVPRDAPVEETVAGLTKFGHDLYMVAADPAKNTVISPLSIGYAFGMARAGAGGRTASQLDHVFGSRRRGRTRRSTTSIGRSARSASYRPDRPLA